MKVSARRNTIKALQVESFRRAPGVMVFRGVNALNMDSPKPLRAMYGMIVDMTAADGQREALIEILREASLNMPGCLSYVIARDAVDANKVWVTEVWDTKENHDASLSRPNVREAITKARPLIATFGHGTVTTPMVTNGAAFAR